MTGDVLLDLPDHPLAGVAADDGHRPLNHAAGVPAVPLPVSVAPVLGPGARVGPVLQVRHGHVRAGWRGLHER